jgi:dTMP kinase
MQGKLIAIEGCDSSGKHTQAKLLLEGLKKEGKDAVLVSFPRYETFFGGLVKKHLSGEFGSLEEVKPEFAALLFSLDRYNAMPFLEQQLQEGKLVVCDRYIASNIAHQAAKFEGEEQDKFIEWISSVEARLPKPSATVFLDLPVEASIKLMQSRDREKDLYEKDKAYLESTRRAYQRLSKNPNWITVDCSSKQGIRPIQKIQEEIRAKVAKLI